MSNSRLELLRSAFETIENLEKALVQAYSYKERYVSEKIITNVTASRDRGL